jgi:hypothetical protein
MPGLPESYVLTSTRWIHGRQAGKPRRNLDHRLADEHRDRVQVAGVRLEPEPLRLERQCAAAGKGVVERGELMPVEQLPCPRMIGIHRTGPPPARPDLVARRLQDPLVRGVLPHHQLLDDPEQPLPLLLLRCLRGEEVRARRGVVHHLREDHRPRRRQRPPRPPQVQRARVPVPDRLLPRRGLVDGFERERDLDELLRLLH